MKKLLFALTVFVAVLSGCTKNYYGDSSQPPFLINGLNDISIDEYRSTVYSSISVVYNSGEQERVYLSIEGLPTGIQTYINGASGMPSFSSYIYFYDTSATPATPGVYEANLVVKNAAQKVLKKYPFKVTVNAVEDCRDQIIGAGQYYNYCASGSSNFAGQLTKSATSKRIIVNNFENTGTNLEIIANCSSQTITVPTQMVGAYSIYGSGSYYQSGTSMNVSIYYYKTSSGTGTTSCNFRFYK